MIKTWGKINIIETREKTGKVNKTMSWFFEKINKIDKPLGRINKKKGEKTHIINKWEKGHYNWCHRNKKDYKRLQWTITCQLTG